MVRGFRIKECSLVRIFLIAGQDWDVSLLREDHDYDISDRRARLWWDVSLL